MSLITLGIHVVNTAFSCDEADAPNEVALARQAVVSAQVLQSLQSHIHCHFSALKFFGDN